MARQPVFFNLTPDGIAFAVGLPTTLEEMSRYGILITSSWKAVATTVSSSMLIQSVDLIGVVFSTHPYLSGKGEFKAHAFI